MNIAIIARVNKLYESVEELAIGPYTKIVSRAGSAAANSSSVRRPCVFNVASSVICVATAVPVGCDVTGLTWDAPASVDTALSLLETIGGLGRDGDGDSNEFWALLGVLIASAPAGGGVCSATAVATNPG